MTELHIIIGCIVLYVAPIVGYFIRVRPSLSGMEWRVLVCGVLATCSMLFPVFSWGFGPFGFILLYIWMYAMPILIVAYAVVWCIGAVKKTRFCMSGGVMAGVIPLASGLLLGNMVAIVLGGCYLFMLLRARYEWSSEY